MHPVVCAIGKVLRLVGDIEPGGFDAEAQDGLRSAFVEDNQSFQGRDGQGSFLTPFGEQRL